MNNSSDRRHSSSVDSSEGRKIDAKAYLNEHRIMELIDNMTAMLVHARPDHPREFMRQKLEMIQYGRRNAGNMPTLFDGGNLISLFGVLDAKKTGFITHAQYMAAMQTLGVTEFDEAPEGFQTDKIKRRWFVNEAKKGLMKAGSTYKKQTTAVATS